MLNYHLNTRFIKQFRKDYPVYLWSGKPQYRDFYFRQYAGNDKDAVLAERLLMNKWNDTGITAGIIKSLKKECIPSSYILSGYIRKLVNKLHSYACDEPYAAYFYNRLLTILDPLVALENTFRRKVLQSIFDKLKAMHKGTTAMSATEFVCSEEVKTTQLVIAQYLIEIRGYYAGLDNFLQQESHSGSPVKLTTQIEQNLLKLLALMEKSIGNIENINALLQKWEKFLAKLEIRELYN